MAVSGLITSCHVHTQHMETLVFGSNFLVSHNRLISELGRWSVLLILNVSILCVLGHLMAVELFLLLVRLR